MALSAVFASVEKRLTTVLANLGDQLPSYGHGESDHQKLGAPPRITWIPRGGAVKPSPDRGGDGVSNPAPLWSREVTVAIEVWGKDFDATEALAGHLVAAMHGELTRGSYEITGEDWDTSGLTGKGQPMMLTAIIKTPWTREPSKTVVLASAPITQTIVTEVQ